MSTAEDDVALLAGLNSLALIKYSTDANNEHTQRGSRQDWRKFLPQNRGQQPPQQYPQNYPPQNYPPQQQYPQHYPPQNYVPRPQNMGSEYPDIPQDNLAIPNVAFLQLPMVNGQPVGGNPLQYGPTGQTPPQAQGVAPYGGLQGGNFQMPSYDEERKATESQFDKIMQEVKLLRRDVRKLTKLMTDAYPHLVPPVVEKAPKIKEDKPKEEPSTEPDFSETTFKL